MIHEFRIDLFASAAVDAGVFDLYWETEQKSQKYLKRMSYYIIFHQSMFMVNLIAPILCILGGDCDPTQWNLSFNLAMPFDQTVAWGWILRWFVDFSMGFSYSTALITITAYFVCCCFYIESLCNHFDLLIKSVDRSVVSKANWRKLTKQLNEAVRFHVEIFE